MIFVTIAVALVLAVLLALTEISLPAMAWARLCGAWTLAAAGMITVAQMRQRRAILPANPLQSLKSP